MDAQLLILAVAIYDSFCRCHPEKYPQVPWHHLLWNEQQDWILRAKKCYDEHFTRDGKFRMAQPDFKNIKVDD
jgi:hypothetical protein